MTPNVALYFRPVMLHEGLPHCTRFLLSYMQFPCTLLGGGTVDALSDSLRQNSRVVKTGGPDAYLGSESGPLRGL
jgi:hypothetical protein